MILRLGRVKKGGAVGPGLFFVLPCLDDIITVDLRTVTFDVPPQEILTKDSVTVAVDAVVYFKVFNPMKSVVNVANASQSTRLLASTTLRNMLGTKILAVRCFAGTCYNYSGAALAFTVTKIYFHSSGRVV